MASAALAGIARRTRERSVTLGLLPLTGAFAWQKARPRPAPDLREAPRALV